MSIWPGTKKKFREVADWKLTLSFLSFFSSSSFPDPAFVSFSFREWWRKLTVKENGSFSRAIIFIKWIECMKKKKKELSRIRQGNEKKEKAAAEKPSCFSIHFSYFLPFFRWWSMCNGIEIQFVLLQSVPILPNFFLNFTENWLGIARALWKMCFDSSSEEIKTIFTMTKKGFDAYGTDCIFHKSSAKLFRIRSSF